MQGLTEPFLISLAVEILQSTEAKSREVCTVLLDKGLFLKNQTTFAANHSVWPLSAFSAFGCLDGQIVVQSLQNFTSH